MPELGRVLRGRPDHSSGATNDDIRGHNNNCLEANNTQIQGWPQLPAGQTRRADLRMAACNGGSHQKWSITEAGQVQMFGTMCLDIVGGVSADNAAVQLYPCHGGQNQRWLNYF